MSGCVVVRGVVWCGSPFPFSLLSFGLGVCVGVLGGLGACVCVGLGVLIDVAAPQRGDQVKQVFYKKDLAKTATIIVN